MYHVQGLVDSEYRGGLGSVLFQICLISFKFPDQ